MKYFNFRRFVNVARWDLTINSKFYLRSSVLVVALCCFPILMYYLHAMLTGDYFTAVAYVDNIEPFAISICFVALGYLIIASGYMFHNLLTRQGRINELTLPATNLEKFVWHFLVVAVGTQIVMYVGLLCADLLNFLLRLGVAGPTRSITAFVTTIEFNPDTEVWNWPGYEMFTLFVLGFYSFRGSFSLVNAWKYKHNIPLTILLHFVLNNVFGLSIVIFVTSKFAHSEAFLDFVEKLGSMNPDAIFISLCAFFILLYCGILYLTYHLYTRAQLSTKRNP